MVSEHMHSVTRTKGLAAASDHQAGLQSLWLPAGAIYITTSQLLVTKMPRSTKASQSLKRNEKRLSAVPHVELAIDKPVSHKQRHTRTASPDHDANGHSANNDKDTKQATKRRKINVPFNATQPSIQNNRAKKRTQVKKKPYPEKQQTRSKATSQGLTKQRKRSSTKRKRSIHKKKIDSSESEEENIDNLFVSENEESERSADEEAVKEADSIDSSGRKKAKRLMRSKAKTQNTAKQSKSPVKRRSSRRKQRHESPESEEDIDELFVNEKEESEKCAEKEDKKGSEDNDNVADKDDNMEKMDDKKKTDSKTNCEEKADESSQDESTLKQQKSGDEVKRKAIRQVMSTKRLQEATVQAAKDEKERRDRVKELRKKHKLEMITDSKTKFMYPSKLVLEYEEDGVTEAVEVKKAMLKKMKPHQAEAVEFMWDCCIESSQKAKDGDVGSGCILAHCMGLGKTLSVISFAHTVMTALPSVFKTCLVVCPLNTVLNWVNEWNRWVPKKEREQIYELATVSDMSERVNELKTWREEGGVMVIGYQLFRILVNTKMRSKKRKDTIMETLINPGPDLVVCDEGHMLKNDMSAIAKCMNEVKTKRRIVLTGTPLQNNLIEYHCMVSFVKPHLLGTRKEFSNRFVNPIMNGQHKDSTAHDTKVMKRRAHVLHEMLAGFVQRRDYAALTKFLRPKHEYVISVRLSKVQIDFYTKYLNKQFPNSSEFKDRFKGNGASLFSDYQNLMRIWTHPWVLKLEQERREKQMLAEELDDEINFFTSSSEDLSEDWSSEDEQSLKKHPSKKRHRKTKIHRIASSEDSGDESSDQSDAERTSPARLHVSRRQLLRRAATKQCYTNGDVSSDMDDDESNIDNNEEALITDDNKPVTQRDKTTSEQQKHIRRDDSRPDKAINENCTQKLKDYSHEGVDKSKTQYCSKPQRTASHKAMNSSNVNATEKSSDEVAAAKKTKVIAGEIIREWKSKSRRTDDSDKQEEDYMERFRKNLWFSDMLKDDMENDMELSGKLILMMEIIRMSTAIGDKVLVFSQSLLTLDIIEKFLAYESEQCKQEEEKEKMPKPKGKKGKRKSQANKAVEELSFTTWVKDEDYLRLDGSTSASARTKNVSDFTEKKNVRLRLFLISTKAGGLGINLDIANRVIIFDASWNPSHDIQSIFRVYRFGQLKDVFVYRFLAQGTMEEKIYERQVNKETLSQRVVDEQQLDRHFNQNDLQELYCFEPDRLDDPNRKERPTPVIPKDFILAEILSHDKKWIVKYHEHDSLLERRPEEDLSEEERKAAWEEYEKEKQGIPPAVSYGGAGPQPYLATQRYPTIRPISLAAYTQLQTYQQNSTRGPLAQLPQPHKIPSFIHSAVFGALVEKYSQANLLTLHAEQSRIQAQLCQLPRVVMEIIKYNPHISEEELKRRLTSFLGMPKQGQYRKIVPLQPANRIYELSRDQQQRLAFNQYQEVRDSLPNVQSQPLPTVTISNYTGQPSQAHMSVIRHAATQPSQLLFRSPPAPQTSSAMTGCQQQQPVFYYPRVLRTAAPAGPQPSHWPTIRSPIVDSTQPPPLVASSAKRVPKVLNANTGKIVLPSMVDETESTSDSDAISSNDSYESRDSDVEEIVITPEPPIEILSSSEDEEKEDHITESDKVENAPSVKTGVHVDNVDVVLDNALGRASDSSSDSDVDILHSRHRPDSKSLPVENVPTTTSSHSDSTKRITRTRTCTTQNSEKSKT